MTTQPIHQMTGAELLTARKAIDRASAAAYDALMEASRVQARAAGSAASSREWLQAIHARVAITCEELRRDSRGGPTPRTR